MASRGRASPQNDSDIFIFPSLHYNRTNTSFAFMLAGMNLIGSLLWLVSCAVVRTDRGDMVLVSGAVLLYQAPRMALLIVWIASQLYDLHMRVQGPLSNLQLVADANDSVIYASITTLGFVVHGFCAAFMESLMYPVALTPLTSAILAVIIGFPVVWLDQIPSFSKYLLALRFTPSGRPNLRGAYLLLGLMIMEAFHVADLCERNHKQQFFSSELDLAALATIVTYKDGLIFATLESSLTIIWLRAWGLVAVWWLFMYSGMSLHNLTPSTVEVSWYVIPAAVVLGYGLGLLTTSRASDNSINKEMKNKHPVD